MFLPYVLPLLLCPPLLLASAFDVNLMWDVPDDAKDITQASAHIQLNSTSSPIGTEWIGVGWDTGAISLQKLSNDQLVVLMQVRAPNNTSTVRAGRVTEYASAHYIDREDRTAKQGMYLQSKVDKDDAANQSITLKVIAHYNMIANNTIYQGLWSDGEVWTYMGSLVLQHPKTGSIKEEVARALEDAARIDDSGVSNGGGAARTRDTSRALAVAGGGNEASAAVRAPEAESTVPAGKDPLSGTKPPETLATCDITRDSEGRIRPVADATQEIAKRPGALMLKNDVTTTCEVAMFSDVVGVFAATCITWSSPGVMDPTVTYNVVYNRGPGYTYGKIVVSKIVPHPQFNPNNFANNLAVVILPSGGPGAFTGQIADWPSEWQTFYLTQRGMDQDNMPTWLNPKTISVQNSTTDYVNCKRLSEIYALNQYDFICSPQNLPTSDANCVYPYGSVFEYDGTQATLGAILSHGVSDSAALYCGTSPIYNYYIILAHYWSWIETTSGYTFSGYHSPNAAGYVKSSDPNYQMVQQEQIVIINPPVPGTTQVPSTTQVPGTVVIPRVFQSTDATPIAPIAASTVPPVTVTSTTTATTTATTTTTSTSTTTTTATFATTSTTVSTVTTTAVSVFTFTQPAVSFITVPAPGAPAGNQSIGVGIGINIPTVTTTTTTTATTTSTITITPNAIALTATVPAAVTVTTTVVPTIQTQVTVTATATALSTLTVPGGVSVIPITQFQATTVTVTSTVASTIMPVMPATVAYTPVPSATSTFIPTTEEPGDSPRLSPFVIAAIVLFALLALAALVFFIVRRRKQKGNHNDSADSRVRRWLFFGRYQNRDSYRASSRMPRHQSRDSYRAPSRMSELTAQGYSQYKQSTSIYRDSDYHNNYHYHGYYDIDHYHDIYNHFLHDFYHNVHNHNHSYVVVNPAPGGNQNIGIGVSVNLPTVTVTSTMTSTTTALVTVTAPAGPLTNPGNAVAPVTVTVTAAVGPNGAVPATVTATTTLVSVVSVTGPVSIIPVTQYVATTNTVTTTVTSLVAINAPGSTEFDYMTSTTQFGSSTSLPTDGDGGSNEPPVNVAAIVAIILLALLALAALIFFIRRRRKQKANNNSYEDTRVRNWWFFGRKNDRDSYRAPSRMSDLTAQRYR
ncbi:hypothetical protein GGI04_001952 [Coemansia thaxteri]|nr:hypothetical protein GGI04_001952 [Coemansia thaxteri]